MESNHNTVCRKSLLRLAVVLGLTFSVAGCATQKAPANPLLADAEAFCEVYQPQHWRDQDPELGLFELETLAQQQLREVLRTEQFKDLIITLDEVNHYRELYPTAKSEIERLIGTEWNCPAYQQFFDIESRKQAGE